MDDTEYVETSDAEELEICHGIETTLLSDTIASSPARSSHTPRKRRKIYHSTIHPHDVPDGADGPLDLSSLHGIDGSITPVHSSPGPFTSIDVPDDKQHDSIGHTYGLDNALLEGRDVGEVMTPIELPVNRSQDELDVISQPLSPEDTRPRQRDSTRDVHALDTEQILPLNSQRQPSENKDPSGLETGSRSHELLSLFSSQLEDPPGGDSPYHGSSYSSRIHEINRPGPSSLPPSSPPRTSTPLINTPLRSRSYSPEQTARVLPRFEQIFDHGQYLSKDKEALSDLEEGHDDTMPRRYSLRTRQARQLKPYEYDKLFYKRQMQRLPDAIVKVVSPRRHNASRIHKRRETEEDDDFIVTEEEETQEEGVRVERHRDSSEALNEKSENQLAWLPDVYQLSNDDDLTPLSPLTRKENLPRSAAAELHGSHRATQRGIHKFPLIEARVREANGSTKEPEKVPGRTNLAVTYKKRKDVRSSLAKENRPVTLIPPPKTEQHASCAVSLSETVRHEFEPDSVIDIDVPVYDDFWDEEWPARLPDSGSIDPHSDNGNSRVQSGKDDEMSDSYYETSHVDRMKSLHYVSHSDTDSDDASETEPYMHGLNGRQKRALKRMMPGILIKKLLGKQNTTAKTPGRSRSKSVASVPEDSSGSEETSLAPGRSRIVKRPGNARISQQIRGDSESSDPEIAVGLVKKPSPNVIDIVSSDSDATTASSPNYPSDEDVLGDSIADSGYFDQDFSRQPTHRREEPLIDMMLCRVRGRICSPRNRSRKRQSRQRLKIGEHSLRADGLEVSISKSPSKPCSRRHHSATRQPHLRFESSMSPTCHHGVDATADLMNSGSAPGVTRTIHTDAARTGQFESSKRLTKKQRRETVQKATLHTLPGKKRKIASGRRKGFMTVQIDMADDGLQRAIKPLNQDSPLQVQPVFDRTQSAKVGLLHRRTLHGPGLSSNGPALKQTSLHDFAFQDEYNSDAFEYSTARQPARSTKNPEWHNEGSVRTCTVDLGISVPTPGLSFSAETYLGKQLLPDLLGFAYNSGTLSRPSAYEGFGLVRLQPEMQCGDFVEALDVTCNIISEWINEESVESDPDNMHRYERLMQSICHFAPWIYENADGEGRNTVQTAITSFAGRLNTVLQEKVDRDDARPSCPDRRCLSVMWFNVQLTTRMLALARRHRSNADVSYWKSAVSVLIKSLVKYGIDKALDPIEARDMSSSSISLLAAELWVCLIHLLPQADHLHHTLADGSGFWSIILQIMKDGGRLAMSNIEASEHLWRLIFGLCAMSYFSAHGIATSEPRIPTCWEIVGLALDTIRLTHDNTQDSTVSREILKRRDRYLRMVVARCFILSTKWKWSLRDANAVFKKLVDIFRSRNFGNLLGEQSEFPAFMRYHNIDLLDELRASDTAFGLYLKLVMQASKVEINRDIRSKARLTKLLSLAVPLSGVGFSKDSPPTNDELSMLVNRFSAIVMAILIDGKENAKVQSRINQARRFVNFTEADDRSRDVCISAAMYTTVAVNHLSLRPDEPLTWLGDMCQVLVEEYQRTATDIPKDMNGRNTDGTQRVRHRLVLSLHLILSCVTNIINKPDMVANDSKPCYPNINLISGPWVKRVFPMKELTNIISTRILILQLVQSFLRARQKVIPPPRRSVPVTPPEDQSESQDLFEEFDLDDDILALIPMDSETEENLKKDKEVAEIMNTEIVPNLFRLLLQYFNDPTARRDDESLLEDYWSNADEWIDCWVGCAAIVVRNEKRAWDHYLNVGPASWAGIGDPFFRRRVAVRFMYQMLKYDPTAYNKDYERHFLAVFLQCLVTHRVTIENEYISALLSVDGLHHPLLRGIPVNKSSEQENFHVSRADFLRTRHEIISHVFSNLDSILLSSCSERDKNILVECALEMLAVAEDTWTSLSSPDRDKYSELCRHIFSSIRKHRTVHNLRRLSSSVAWGDATFAEPIVA